MKKRLIAIILVLALAAGLAVPAAAANIRTEWTDITYRGISIVINDVEIAPCDEKGNSTEPFIMNDTTYLPVRAIAGALGLDVGWEAATSTVVLESGGEANYGNGNPSASFNVKHVQITYRGTKISLDGENIPLVNRNGQSVEPFIYNGSNYLPLRVVSEALGLSVGWDGATSTITLKGGTEPEEPLPPPSSEKVLMPIEEKYSIGYTGFPSSFEEVMTTQYTYNARGQLLKIASSDGYASLVCKYDNKGRLAEGTVTSNGYPFVLKAAYGEDGALVGHFEDGALMEGYVAVKDSQGRIIEEHKLVDGHGSFSYKYKYDAEGRLILRTTLDIAGKGMNNVYREYFYDAQGHLEWGREYAGNYENIETYGDRIYYDCDEQGRVIKEEWFAYDAQEPRLVICSTYDEAGRVAKETKLELTYGGLFGASSFYYGETEYTYDSADRPIIIDVGHFNVVDSEEKVREYVPTATTKTQYSYDEAGRTTKELFEERFVDGYSVTEEKTWAYNEQGLLISETRDFEKINPGGTDESNGQNDYYTYDEAGRLTLHRSEELYNGAVSRVILDSCSYNENGDILEHTNGVEGGDSFDKESYEYDSEGRLKKVSVSHAGVLSAINLYDYDENGLLVFMESQSVAEGVSVISEVSYAPVPKAEPSEFLGILIDRFQMLIS